MCLGCLHVATLKIYVQFRFIRSDITWRQSLGPSLNDNLNCSFQSTFSDRFPEFVI